MIGTSVRRSNLTAIFGPNLLEISLPINYDVERKTLDRPETVARLEALIEELTGRRIRIRFGLAEAIESVAKPSLPGATSQRQQIVEDPEDPFVQDVSKVFGVGSWTVREVIVETSDDNSSEIASE
jgi:hypothetical protein